MSAVPGFPIGSVVAFSGDCDSGSPHNGWYLCDGYGLDQDDYMPLYQVIGRDYGGSGSTTFHLPDYQGQFLRGVDSGTGRDPDVSSRMPPRSDLDYNGASGSSCGSRQASAMADNHTHNYVIYRQEQDTRLTDAGDNYDVADYDDGSYGSADTQPSGRGELRPVNQYVNFIIQSIEQNPADSLQPGMVVAYAGDCSSSDVQTALEEKGWLLCDGRSESTESSDYGELYGVIAETYGSEGAGSFCIPRYFGQFLRGVDLGGEVDPDCHLRMPPRPDLVSQGNNSGIGSIQAQDYPSHTHGYSTKPNNDIDTDGAIHDRLLLDDYSNLTTTSNGSNMMGNESRPKNVALEYLIFCQGEVSTEETIPPGVVVAFAGDAASEHAHFDPSDPEFCGWILCEGQSCNKNQWSDLFAAIGYAHGGSGDSFNVPDPRGLFVRAVDHSRDFGLNSVDPGPRESKSGGNASGVGSFQGDAVNTHEHGYSQRVSIHDLEGGSQEGVGEARDTWGASKPKIVNPASGRDAPVMPILSSENRPTNMYVYYLIKT